jgi:hypothetical protein
LFSLIPFSLPPPVLRTISTGFILFSYVDTKYIHHIHPHSPFLCTPSYWYSPPEKTYFIPLSFIFFSVYWHSPWGFLLGTLGLNISYFNQITPPLLFLYYHAPLIFNSLWFNMLYSYILFQHFSFSKRKLIHKRQDSLRNWKLRWFCDFIRPSLEVLFTISNIFSPSIFLKLWECLFLRMVRL